MFELSSIAMHQSNAKSAIFPSLLNEYNGILVTIPHSEYTPRFGSKYLLKDEQSAIYRTGASPSCARTGTETRGKSVTRFLPYGRQSIDDDDVAAVVDVLRGDWLTTGPAVQRFEEAFADAVGAQYAVSCSSGTAALHLSALAAGLGPGDSAVVPAITFAATANAAHYVGADALVSDVSADNGLLTPELLEAQLQSDVGKSVQAVLPVHLAGQCADMARIRETADAVGAIVIEDACHALGTVYCDGDAREHKVGDCRYSDMTVFSLHPVKTITMGEGGVITTNDAKLAHRLRLFRSHGIVHDPADFREAKAGRDPDGGEQPWYYEQQLLGYNYRASDIHCALGLSQLSRLEDIVAKRRALAAFYDKQLANLAPLVVPIARELQCAAAWHLYPVLIDFEQAGLSRASLTKRLRERGIGTQVHYIPLYRHPYFERRYGEKLLPGAERYYRKTLSLPLHPSMSENDVTRVCNDLTDLLSD
jgi:UDP-4-amino-4,6-dideoxy-N-acetyl-beta-L-altrosamine transaminase